MQLKMKMLCPLKKGAALLPNEQTRDTFSFCQTRAINAPPFYDIAVGANEST